MFSIGAFVLIAIIIMRFFGKVKRTQEMDREINFEKITLHL